MKKKQVRVLTYGTYDLITPGHIQHLKESKAMGDYLIVGLSTDEFNAIKHKRSYLTYEERKIVMEAIKYVDEVIPEKDWDQKPGDIKKYNIDILTMGSDWEGNPKFEYLKEYCDVRFTERPFIWSSTAFRENVDKYVKEIEAASFEEDKKEKKSKKKK